MGPSSTSALSPACSGARQQSSDDTAFGKQLPDAEVVATESTENWLTHQASRHLKKTQSGEQEKRRGKAFGSQIPDPIVFLK
ncbi:hypothetical protein EYF80_009519 [Liparis tanakae]|uniref:Uncharacterized protein n=1 Tax=Liparis tanakae TaxID=230148 RepID=A0A4Z2IRN2_9TELE|nr:hypothetical protein EYF80_009519 [Liparis tanakae]